MHAHKRKTTSQSAEPSKTTYTQQYDHILTFWFAELDEKCWWQPSQFLDMQIATRYQTLLAQARRDLLSSWRHVPEGRLAEIIVLDQFSRNIYRGSPESFAADAQALSLAQEAIALNADQALPIRQRAFFYLPFMHSENAEIHEHAIQLFSQPGLEVQLDFEKQHKAIIDRFGRYPHRNKILGRASTPEEKAFLLKPGSSF
ncbi:MAG: hypothetical protein CMF31_06560 [Kordiimonas sp.]|nr:hypothetical protein [Kordiimonas sp.]|tara:strand:- start:976 stop:1578 length:603 start_codon:yes stop_codon:yes gene_type:complete